MDCCREKSAVTKRQKRQDDDGEMQLGQKHILFAGEVGKLATVDVGAKLSFMTDLWLERL